ncbi:hypothetical protein M3629_19025 [Paenibacillus polysaccharolyticus]|nr:hypothetical protein [Paenibacillus polysaccharolyticus]
MSKYKQVLIMILIAVPFTIINFSFYLKGHPPHLVHAVASLLFLLAWFVLGFKSKGNEFVLRSTLFWLTGVILLLAGYYLDVALLFIPGSILWAGPVYGLRYVLNLPSNVMFAVISIVCAYACGVAGFALGRYLKKSP